MNEVICAYTKFVLLLVCATVHGSLVLLGMIVSVSCSWCTQWWADARSEEMSWQLSSLSLQHHWSLTARSWPDTGVTSPATDLRPHPQLSDTDTAARL